MKVKLNEMIDEAITVLRDMDKSRFTLEEIKMYVDIISTIKGVEAQDRRDKALDMVRDLYSNPTPGFGFGLPPFEAGDAAAMGTAEGK